MLEGILLHSIMMPHIFGFFPLIAGALGAWGAGSVVAAGLGTVLTAGMANALLIGGAVAGSGMQAAGAAREQANRAKDW